MMLIRTKTGKKIEIQKGDTIIFDRDMIGEQLGIINSDSIKTVSGKSFIEVTPKGTNDVIIVFINQIVDIFLDAIKPTLVSLATSIFRKILSKVFRN